MSLVPVTIDDVRPFALSLERTYETLVRDRVKFKVGRIVYVAFSRDETLMGFGFPKEEREALVASEPHKFLLPEDGGHALPLGRRAAGRRSTLEEIRELVLDAWRMCVPKSVAARHERGRRFGLTEQDACGAWSACRDRSCPRCPVGTDPAQMGVGGEESRELGLVALTRLGGRDPLDHFQAAQPGHQPIGQPPDPGLHPIGRRPANACE